MMQFVQVRHLLWSWGLHQALTSRDFHGVGDPQVQGESGCRTQFTMGVITKFMKNCYVRKYKYLMMKYVTVDCDVTVNGEVELWCNSDVSVNCDGKKKVSCLARFAHKGYNSFVQRTCNNDDMREVTCRPRVIASLFLAWPGLHIKGTIALYKGRAIMMTWERLHVGQGL